MTMGELLPFTGTDARWDYRCSLTEHPPKLDLRVNYGDDWVESFYEAGHMVQISVTDSDGAVKATAEVATEPKDFWGGETGFTTQPENWDPAPPDIQPYDWVYAWVDNGTSAQVQIGEIRGAIDLETDSIQGTIAAPWFSNENEMVVECHPWGSPEPVDMKSDTVLPDGEDPYSCSWAGEWDIQPGQDVGVGYFGPDGHWVANAFSIPDGRIIAFPEAENVFGYGWPEGTEVRMDISGSANFTMLTTVGPSSWDENDILAYFDFNGLYNLVAGDVVTLSGSGTVETHTVRNLSVTGIDVGANTVSGAADDGEVPFVYLFEYPDQIINPSVESGQWIADFNSVGLDLVPDQCGRVDIWDEAGNSTTVDWCTPNTRFTVWPEWNYLEGYEWPDGAVVSISVEDKEACSTEAVSGYPEWDPSNTFFSLNFPEGCTIEVGDLITLRSEPLNLTHQVQDLAVTAVDEANDTVAGTAVFDPEQYILHTWIHGVDGSYMQLSAEGGGWLADFGAKEFDLQPGMGGRVELVDQASNATAAEWWIPKIVIKAFPIADNLWGYGWPEGSEVHLTLNGTVDFVPPATVGPAPWGDPNDIMAYFELMGYNLVPGDVITLSGSGLEQTYTVRNLSVTSVDAEANTVTGTADEELYVWVFGFDGTELHVTPQDSTWLADFGTIPFDLMDGMCGRAEIGDEFGNATAVDWCIPNPRFTVWPESDRMDGGEWPDGPVSVSVEGKPECSTTKISEGGYFNEPFPEGCDITVGDKVTFSDGVTTRSHTVRNLAITGVDEAADTVAGTADIGEGVSVGVYDFSGESELQLTAEDGTWLADFTLTGTNLVEGMCGYARVGDEVGNVTQADWCIP
jgi:hypothetical protein